MGEFEGTGEVRGTVTILDTETGKTATKDGYIGFYWSEANGSCDCNRQILFGLDDQSGYCLGEKRFLIVEHNYPGYTLDDMNSDYSQDLKDKALICSD